MFEDLRPHLVELRKRLGLSVLSVFVAFIIAFTFHNKILEWITQPLNNALVEVGRIIESQEKATWTMKSDEANQTKTPLAARPASPYHHHSGPDGARHTGAWVEQVQPSCNQLLHGCECVEPEIHVARRSIESTQSPTGHSSQQSVGRTQPLSNQFGVSLHIAFDEHKAEHAAVPGDGLIEMAHRQVQMIELSYQRRVRNHRGIRPSERCSSTMKLRSQAARISSGR